MAGDAAFPYITCMTLFFSLLLAFHFAMAVPERSFSTLTSIKDGTKKRNAMVVASAREGSAQNSNTDITPKQTTKDTHVSDVLKGPKRRGSSVPRPPLQWQNKIFNASEHEVPSGPNPISNSSVHIIVMKLNHTYQSFEHEDLCT
ncbi:hypothetical protein VNO77_23557 [Canavalia gladiata]|uniref:Uncharacterized protein n=1 Tax=Canavalia gladiata TaxID=3824 RepID=A0AAN9QBM1_CANGL